MKTSLSWRPLLLQDKKKENDFKKPDCLPPFEQISSLFPIALGCAAPRDNKENQGTGMSDLRNEEQAGSTVDTLLRGIQRVALRQGCFSCGFSASTGSWMRWLLESLPILRFCGSTRFVI